MGLLDLLLNDTAEVPAAPPSADVNEEAILDQEIMLMLSSIQPARQPAEAEQLLSNMLAASNSISSCSTACNSPSTTVAVSGARPDPPCPAATGVQLQPPPPVAARFTQPATPPAEPGSTQPDSDRGCCGKRKSMELNSSSAVRKPKSEAAKAAKMKKQLEQVQEQLAASESGQLALKKNMAALQAENMSLLERVARLTEKFQRTVEDNAELYRHVIALEQQLQLECAAARRSSNPPGSGADGSGLAALFLQMQQQ